MLAHDKHRVLTPSEPEAQTLMADAWITVREGAPGSVPVTTTTGVAIGQQFTAGRAGHIVVGVDVADSGISRVVATITATPQGWTVRDTSRNGIVIHPWGLAPLRATTDVRLRWPLIGLRVLGTEPDARHWLLLECHQYAIDGADPNQAAGTTLQADPPRPLTPAEQQAIATVFEAVLAWPPPLTPGEPLQLKQAGRRLGITASAVKVRLEGARGKAELLGLDRQVGVTDPAYLHVLTAAGYVPPPGERCGAPSL
jgi:hypothetical protein